jgi:hypothetical protein
MIRSSGARDNVPLAIGFAAGRVVIAWLTGAPSCWVMRNRQAA